MMRIWGWVEVPCTYENPHSSEWCPMASQSNEPLPQRCNGCTHNSEQDKELFPEVAEAGHYPEKVKGDRIYRSVRELFEDNYYEPPQYESSISDGTVEEGENR